MIESSPTPQEAQAALAEASSKAAQVRRADREFSWFLLIVAALYVAVGAIFSVAGRRGSPLALVMLALVVIGFVVGVVWIFMRLRAYSRGGFLFYMFAIAGFNVWNAIVVGVSIGTRYWASTQPTYHLAVSVSIGVIPLILAAILIRRR